MANIVLTVGTNKLITIVNNLPASEKVFFEDNLVDGKINEVDAGTLQHQTILELKTGDAEVSEAHPVGTKYFVKTNERWVQLYRVNQWVKVPGGDTLTLTVETSEEVAYFMSLNGKEFTVTST